MSRLWLVAALGAFLARVLTGPHVVDDAYITFRYARNLAEGIGLVYNPGEWVLGTTAPLWAVMLAAGYRLGFTDLPWLATLLSSLFDAASAALLSIVALRMGWKPFGAMLVGLAWALNPMSVAFSTGGMETSLFVVTALAVLTLAAAGRHTLLAGGVAGLSTLIRPEGALLALAVVGWAWVADRRAAVVAALAAATPIVAAGAVLFVKYGNPLPNTVAAKQVAYQPAWPMENALALLLQASLPGWSTYLVGVLPGPAVFIVATLGLASVIELVRRGVLGMHQRGLAWQPFAMYGALYVVFYVAVGLRGVRLFPWYLVPLEPLYLLGAAAGLVRVGGTARLARLGRWATSSLAAVLVVWQLPAIDWGQPLLPVGASFNREQILLEVGHGLGETLPPNAVVAAPEIGALGYASNLRILDTVGLVSPAAIPYYPLPAEQHVTDNAIPPRLIVDKRPEAVVTLDAFAQRSLLLDPDFLREYRLERSYPAVVWQSGELLLFRRADTP